MMSTASEIEALLEAFLSNRIDKSGLARLRALANDPALAAEAAALIEKVLAEERMAPLAEHDVKAVFRQTMQKTQPARKTTLWRWTAAASVLILLAAGIYWWPQKKQDQTVVKTALIEPGRNGAILTLADGSQLVLDSLGNGEISRQNGSRVTLQNGQLSYDPSGNPSDIVTYNTMTTPKGRQFSLVLPDGTKVWLNAASSIRFPTAFSGKERTVRVTGEAYFEVAQNAGKPFRVSAGGKAEVEVLGTHFNVNAYENEHMVRATLLEGKIRVGGKTLAPGQQAQVAADVKVIDNINIDKIMAWKNGMFNFDGASLEEVMRQLERWYDIEVVYENAPPGIRFVGELSRNISLQDVLEILKRMKLQFRLEEGRKLIVTQ